MTSTEIKDNINADITSKTAPNSISRSDVSTNLVDIVDYVDQEIATVQTPKILALTLLQSGSSAPTVVNEIKTDIPYFMTRVSTGRYEVRSVDSEFLEGKTIPIITNVNQSVYGSTVNIYRTADNSCVIFTKNDTLAFADGILNNYIVKIEVYP